MRSLKKIIIVVKKWNNILDSAQKKKSLYVFFAIIVSSFLETIGVSIIVPFITAIMDTDKLMENKYIILFSAYLPFELNGNSLIILLGILVIFVYIAKNIGLAWTDYVGLQYENQIMKDFSLRMLKSYIYRPYENSLDVNSAEALRGIGNDATALYYMIQALFKIIANILTIIFIGIFLTSTDPFMAVSIVVVAGGMSMFIFVVLRKTVGKSGKIFNEAMFYQNKTAMQALGALKELTIMDRREKFVAYNEEALEIKKKAEIKYRFLQTCPSRIVEIVFIGSIIGIVCFRIMTGMEVAEIVPQLAAFALAATRILPLVNGIASFNATIIYYMPSFNNAYDSIMISEKFLPRSEEENRTAESRTDAGKLVFQKRILIENVAWKYKKSDSITFENLNIEISKGEAVGLIGPSGAGKTTLADIILGLLVPQNGRILVDETDIRKYPHQWSEMIGYVPQTVYLLDDTIRNNIFFGIDDRKKSDDKVWAALDQACLKEFVESLPDGLDTVVGERGAKISGGQRQRIAIARALYNNSEILVLDEATSALDQETEHAVMHAIEKLQGKKTLIIIAHRLSTLEKCDKIFEIKDGKVKKTVLQNL